MIRMVRGALVALSIWGVSVVSASAATDIGEARAAAERLAAGAHAAMSTPDTSEGARLDALETEVSKVFAFDIWERFLLGDKAGAFSEAQIGEFRALLPAYLSRLYFNQFGKGLDQAPEVSEAKVVRSDVLVRAQIPRANGGTLPVDWRLRGFEGRGPLVIDVMVGGASFLLLKRDEFKAVLGQSGPSGLIAFMKDFSQGG